MSGLCAGVGFVNHNLHAFHFANIKWRLEIATKSSSISLPVHPHIINNLLQAFSPHSPRAPKEWSRFVQAWYTTCILSHSVARICIQSAMQYKRKGLLTTKARSAIISAFVPWEIRKYVHVVYSDSLTFSARNQISHVFYSYHNVCHAIYVITLALTIHCILGNRILESNLNNSCSWK